MRTAMRGWWLLVLLAVAGCAGARSVDARLARGEELVGEADTELREAERSLEALDPKRAEGHLREAKEILDEPDVAFSPDRHMMTDRVAAAEAKLEVVRQEVARRALAAEVAAHRGRLDPAGERWKAALEPLGKGSPSRPAVEEAQRAGRALAELLEAGRKLEGSDPDYAAHAKGLQEGLAKGRARLELEGVVLQFVEGPLRERAEAMKQAAAAKKAPPARRKESWSAALARFQGCQAQAQKLIDGQPALPRELVLVEGRKLSVAAIAQSCDSLARPVEKALGVRRAAPVMEEDVQIKVGKKRK